MAILGDVSISADTSRSLTRHSTFLRASAMIGIIMPAYIPDRFGPLSD